MHKHFHYILRNNPNYKTEDATDDSRALELASSGEYLCSKKHDMKAISLDKNFFQCSTATAMIDMFAKINENVNNIGFVEWFKKTVEDKGCYKAQAFLLNCFIDNNISISDFKCIKKTKKTVGVGLESQPREIVLFHYAMEICKSHSFENGQDLELLLHAIFPYRSDEWVSQMIICHLDKNNGDILEEVGDNGLIRLIFKFLVAQSADDCVKNYQVVEYKSI